MPETPNLLTAKEHSAIFGTRKARGKPEGLEQVWHRDSEPHGDKSEVSESMLLCQPGML